MKKNLLFGFKDMTRGSITLKAPSMKGFLKESLSANKNIIVRELKDGKIVLTKKTQIDTLINQPKTV